MLRPSFVPPHEVRVLRDYTRTRVDLTRDRTRHWQRLEKLLEDALIKVTTVASKITTMSVRDMIDALIRGERNPRRWLTWPEASCAASAGNSCGHLTAGS